MDCHINSGRDHLYELFSICFEGLACIDGYDTMTWARLRLVCARDLYLTTRDWVAEL